MRIERKRFPSKGILAHAGAGGGPRLLILLTRDGAVYGDFAEADAGAIDSMRQVR